MSPLSAVTLDSTGTLISCPAMGEIYAEVLARHGVHVTTSDVRRTFPIVWQELDCRTPAGRDRFTAFPGGARAFWGRLVERLCELLEAEKPGPFAVAELYHRFASASAWVVYPDAIPALEAMRALGLKLAVISNFDERLPGILEGLGLAARVDAVVVSSALGVAKPNPAIFHHALGRLGVEARAAIHIGDHRLEDVEGAQGAGMAALLLRRDDPAAGCPDLLAAAEAIARGAGSPLLPPPVGQPPAGLRR
ncbi:MAG TPA: HAD-IA family hydrolase [Thermoanaerobaculia bacterium]|nr:HAD-IA family hydrolase [Thermoanaerobaculia bacterium]